MKTGDDDGSLDSLEELTPEQILRRIGCLQHSDGVNEDCEDCRKQTEEFRKYLENTGEFLREGLFRYSKNRG